MEVFIKKDRQPEPGFSLGVTLNRRLVRGELGLEIEIEGSKLPKADTPAPWTYHVDGSLRGADNGEYVLASPISFTELKPSLDKLWARFKVVGSQIDDSNRTSVHVHLNCQSFHMNRLASFTALWFCMEEVLTEWCGEHRVGNLFCLRAKDAPAIIRIIRDFIRSDGKNSLPESIHYSGLNAHALIKFGSLEVRTLRGTSDPQVILDWVNILQRLYELSEEFTDPRDICAAFSREGPSAFFEYIFGNMSGVVRRGVSFNEDQLCESMYDGIRMAQDICYCRDWSRYKAVKLATDPFGRDPKRVMKRMGVEPAPTPGYLEAALNEGQVFNQNILNSLTAMQQEWIDNSTQAQPIIPLHTAHAPAAWVATPAPTPVEETVEDTAEDTDVESGEDFDTPNF